ncbi:hypothetical protein L6452_10848 [Arctium lappa]|uniref:Uncharacterized protein n=1 Tax=Arctium lappa TaxID=4217 RepID=A0ACB9DMX2_ARCLA|nr:hypothetical protein L6452_10848 [Arctium lappa]
MSDFGSVIIHGGVRIDKTVAKTSVPTAKEPSHILQRMAKIHQLLILEKIQVIKNVGASTYTFRIVESPATERTTQAIGSSGVAISGTTKKDIVNRKALDMLWSIYVAGNTVPIPFLKATDISPIALLSENVLGSQHVDNVGSVVVEA